MSAREELDLILKLIKKYGLPISPILEYAINEKKEEYPELEEPFKEDSVNAEMVQDGDQKDQPKSYMPQDESEPRSLHTLEKVESARTTNGGFKKPKSHSEKVEVPKIKKSKVILKQDNPSDTIVSEVVQIADDNSDSKLVLKSLTLGIKNGKKDPDKPILLLTLLNLIESDYYTSNKFYLSDTLEQEFNFIAERFNYNKRLFRPNMYNALLKMGTEPFWTFVKMSAVDGLPIETENDLKYRVRFSRISELIFKNFKDKVSASLYRSKLVGLCK